MDLAYALVCAHVHIQEMHVEVKRRLAGVDLWLHHVGSGTELFFFFQFNSVSLYKCTKIHPEITAYERAYSLKGYPIIPKQIYILAALNVFIMIYTYTYIYVKHICMYYTYVCSCI